MHHGWALGPIDHDQLQEVRRPIGAEYEIASGILIDRFNDGRMTQGMLDVLRADSVAESRPEDLHESIVLQNCLAGGWASATWTLLLEDGHLQRGPGIRARRGSRSGWREACPGLKVVSALVHRAPFD
jgi:hypothetical protein